MARRAYLLGLALVVLSACGNAATKANAPTVSYDGPLYLTRAAARHHGAGAAGNIVDCRTWQGGGFSAAKVYLHGATADSPQEALDTGWHEGIFDGPLDGLQIAKKERDRVLYVLTERGVIKRAVIVHNGPATKGAGGFGWYVESWASCDYSEFPRSFTDSIGLQIWSDAAGNAVPTPKVESYIGPAHCDWQSMTFLAIGGATYVRAPQSDLADYFARPYRQKTDLPDNAMDTGFHRSGRQLWLSRDRQLAYVGTKSAVEQWPRTRHPLYCS